MISDHYANTGSSVAASILSEWVTLKNNFVKAIATEYKVALARKNPIKKAM
jgi:glutamate synthase domain-containing protein 3